MRSPTRLIRTVVALLLLSGAAAEASAQAPASDPAGPGPFDVGTWQSTITGFEWLDGTPRLLPLVVWYPMDPGSGPFPLVIFSHGASGSPTASTFLTEHVASHGFVVAAVQHPVVPQWQRGVAFANRPREVKATVDFVVAESMTPGAVLHGAIDDTRLGVMGHSFGGLTTLALLAESGNRFLAGIPMAPGIRPGDPADVSQDLPNITAPLMFMMGVRDTLALYSNLAPAYAQIPEATQRHAFVFPTGTHFAYSDACLLNCTDPANLPHALGHALVKTHATAFLQVHLSGQTDFESYLDPSDGIEGGQAWLFAGALPACADGIENDDDGNVDFPADIGCIGAMSNREAPQCQDGRDNDGDGKVDFDGGASSNGEAPVANPDPDCTSPTRDNEWMASSWGCGIGPEIALLVPLLWRRRPRQRSGRVAGPSRRRRS